MTRLKRQQLKDRHKWKKAHATCISMYALRILCIRHNKFTFLSRLKQAYSHLHRYTLKTSERKCNEPGFLSSHSSQNEVPYLRQGDNQRDCLAQSSKLLVTPSKFQLGLESATCRTVLCKGKTHIYLHGWALACKHHLLTETPVAPNVLQFGA